MQKKYKILYLSSNRSHKILPLLEGNSVKIIESIQNLTFLCKEKYRPSLVLIDSFGTKGLLACFVAFFCRAPLVMRFRGDFYLELQSKNKLFFLFFSKTRDFVSRQIAKLVCHQAEGFIFNSHYLHKKLMPIIDNNKFCTVIYNPYTSITNKSLKKEIKQDPNGFYLISVTNMNLKDKAVYLIDRIVEVPLDVWEKYNLYLYICGDGICKSEIISKVNKYNLKNRIILTGKVNNIDQYYNLSHLCIHLTRIDAFPNATLEAMYHNLPVITNWDSCGTIEQVQHKKNGLILQQDDSLVEGIEYYINNPEIRQQHGEFGHSLVEKCFSVHSEREKMNAFLKNF